MIAVIRTSFIHNDARRNVLRIDAASPVPIDKTHLIAPNEQCMRY